MHVYTYRRVGRPESGSREVLLPPAQRVHVHPPQEPPAAASRCVRARQDQPEDDGESQKAGHSVPQPGLVEHGRRPLALIIPPAGEERLDDPAVPAAAAAPLYEVR